MLLVGVFAMFAGALFSGAALVSGSWKEPPMSRGRLRFLGPAVACYVLGALAMLASVLSK